MSEKQSLKTSIIEINNTNDVTKEIIMLVHKVDHANGNGLDFKLEHTEQYKETLVNKPVVAKYYPLKDDLGDHEAVFDQNGRIIGLETIAIGTITEAWIDDYEINSETTVKALYAKATLWNYKYPEVISCVEKLHNGDGCDSSVEVEIYQYGENPTQQYRYSTNYEYLGNCLLGSSVLPADANAGVLTVAQKEIAMAAKKDLDSLEEKGDEEMPESNKEVFNKGFEVKIKGNEKELNDLRVYDLREKIYNIINPVNAETEVREYNYFIREIFISPNYVVLEDWDDETTLVKANYTISNGNIALEDKDNWQQVELTYQPVGIELNQLLDDKAQEVAELNNKITQYKEELSTMSEQNQEQVVELETKVQELNTKIEELNGLLVSEKEVKSGLEEQITELNSQIEDLQTYKEKFETAQKEAKQKELNEKYGKILSEKTFQSEAVQKAIEEVNEVELNSIAVTEMIEQKAKQVEVNSKEKSEDVSISVSAQEDLLPENKHDYWAAPRS